LCDDFSKEVTRLQYRAIKTKLKVNDCQATLMAQHAGLGRWVWNWALRLWEEAYKVGLKPNAAKLKKLFTNHIKPQHEWMNGLSSRVYQYAFQHLGEAFNRFFKGLAKYPNFKKKGLHDSFTLDATPRQIKLTGVRHKLPVIGWVRTHETLAECQTKKVTISREADGWYLSFHIEFEPKETPKNREIVGVDLGINSLATLSSGIVFPNLKPYRSALKRLAKLQRNVSRKTTGSKNRAYAITKLARQHQRVANIRKDALHNITSYLAKNHGTVVIEDLHIAGMLKNHPLAQSIADVAFGEFRRQLEYKCQWYGAKLLVVSRFFPSSQLCSGCGYQQKMPLHVRTFDCRECGLSINRDLNASINLENAAGYVVSASRRGAADSPG
jgi:putative transposase